MTVPVFVFNAANSWLGRAVARVVVGPPPLGPAASASAAGPIERLDLTLLIDAQHQRAIRWLEIYTPAISCTFSMRSGSVDSLKVSVR
jgi:hypothetical protein